MNGLDTNTHFSLGATAARSTRIRVNAREAPESCHANLFSRLSHLEQQGR